MYSLATLIAASLLSSVRGQQFATQSQEVHPTLLVSQCTSSGCTVTPQSVVLDASWRPPHAQNGNSPCINSSNNWDPSECSDPATCAANCAVDGVSYPSYGISTSGFALTLDFVTGSNIGSRVFLLSSNNQYQQLALLNKEFTFDVNLSNLPCGVKGGVHLSAMSANGGYGGTNHAGATYGTGYCDAQCPENVKWINGQANLVNWNPSTSTGQSGSCCPEVNVFDANSQAASFSAHPCSNNGQTVCTNGNDCGDGDDRYNGVCDKDGCDFNSYRTGDQTFLGQGSGFTVDTTQTFTVVTQFISSDGTANGQLAGIKRFYVQSGYIIANSNANIPGLPSVNELTDDFCANEKMIFGETDVFTQDGGLAALGNAVKAGMTLALSILDDPATDLQWLDGQYPAYYDPSMPGVLRGPCDPAGGDPATVESQLGGASVTYSNIKWGTLGSTYSGRTRRSASFGQ